MKITHVNFAKGWGGGEIQTLTLVQTLRKNFPDIENVLVVRKGGEFAARLAKTDIPFVEVKSFSSGHFDQAIKGSTLCHAHDGRAPYWCLLHRILRGTPYLITRRVPNALGTHLAVRIAYNSAKFLVGLTNRIAETFPKSNVERRIIPSAWLNSEVSEQKVVAIKSEFPDEFVVAHLATLTPVKNHEATLDAARILQEKGANVRFMILGKGPREQELKEKSKDLKNVTWCGHKDDISNYVQAANVVILPSLVEGLGSSLLEAYHRGKPVVGANIDGIPEVVIPGETGFLHDPHDAASLAEYIEKMYKDAALYAHLCDGAKAAAGQYSPQTNAKAYVELYRSIAE